MLVALIDGFSAHRYQIGVEGERGAKEADQQKMEPSPHEGVHIAAAFCSPPMQGCHP